MATPDALQQPQLNNPNEEDDSASEANDLLSESSSESSDSSDSDSDSDKSDSDSPVSQSLSYAPPDGTPNPPYDSDLDNTEEANLKDLNKALYSRRRRLKELELEKEEEEAPRLEDLYDFPPDPEDWQEEDLKELWADAPLAMTKPGWDPSNVDEDEVDIISDEIKAGRDPPIAPFYVPYRKPYPVIPDDHYDISNPKAVIEELDRIEEFLTWVSYIFPDGTTYEGTVWDDQAHGRGVFVAEEGLVRYEGDWLQNNMEGHGVVEVEVPHMQPIPGSKLEAKMRAEGQIITRDFMSPEDREWLEKDIEDSLLLADGEFEVPWYENEEWVRQFGEKPEKGRYRYAGQWKHGRMHGCGVYEVNERLTFGRFYFGELLEDSTGCDADVSGLSPQLHAGLAEVAAAKARMFVNKPDGMVREYFGPYSDPQHPYFYEEDDVWMAPGFINQFYDVPDYWKMYISEVDQERQMWLNSFYKAPLRLPMPSELEYWWSQDQNPEFVLINKEQEPDPNNPDKLIHTEDPLILHTPTGRLIDYMEDEEHGMRLFWLPPQGEEVDPGNVEFLPLGFDEFYGLEEVEQEDNFLTSLVKSMERKSRPILDKLNNWIDEKKQAREEEAELLKAELEMLEAELDLKVAIEDFDRELKQLQKVEENRIEEPKVQADISISDSARELEQPPPEPELEPEPEEEEEEQEDDDAIPSSFGSVEDKRSNNSDQNSDKSGKSTFASVSLSFASSNLVSLVPTKLCDSFSRWKGEKFPNQTSPAIPRGQFHQPTPNCPGFCMVSFPRTANRNLKLRCARQTRHTEHISKLGLRNHSKRKASPELGHAVGHFNILSLHTPLPVSLPVTM